MGITGGFFLNAFHSNFDENRHSSGGEIIRENNGIINAKIQKKTFERMAILNDDIKINVKCSIAQAHLYSLK